MSGHYTISIIIPHLQISRFDQALTPRHSALRQCIRTLEHPRLIHGLIVREIPPMLWILTQIVALACVLREHVVRRNQIVHEDK